jgi:hypothetical protein
LGPHLLAIVTDTPQHLTHPAAFQAQPNGRVKLATADQGSDRHVRDQVARVASYPIGTRDELPEFGITPLVFQTGDLRLDVVKAQIERWVDTDLTAEELADAAALARRTVHLAPGPVT